jgi:MFS family permease
MSYNRQNIFASACAGLFLFGIGVITLGSIAPDLKTKFGLDDLGIGGLFSLFPVGILVGSLSFGPITDRFGYKLLLAICSLFLGLGFLGLGLAQAIGWIQICILLIGVGGGAINGATSALVADTSGDNKGARLALFGVFFGLGALAMPFVLGLLKDVASFEDLVLVIGGLALVLALLYLLLQFPEAKHREGISLSHLVKMLKDPLLLLIGFFLFWQSACEALINNWTTTYLLDRMHLSNRWALYALSCYVAGIVVMRLLTGSVFSKIPATRMLSLGMRLLVFGALLLGWMTGLGWAIAGLVAVGLGLALGFPVMFGISSSLYSQTSGTAIGIVLAISLIGNLLANYIMGYMANSWGIGVFSFALIVAATVQAVVCNVLLRRVG